MEKKKSFLEEMEGDLGLSLVTDLVPKLGKYIKPSIEALENFIGDDGKIIVIRKIKSGVFAIIIDTVGKDSDFEITKSKMNVPKDMIHSCLPIDNALVDILSGSIGNKNSEPIDG